MEAIQEILRYPANRVKEKYIYEHYNDLYKKIEEFCLENRLDKLSFKQKFWHYVNDIKEIPKCKTCNKDISVFRSITEGYAKYCSAKCSANNLNTKQKKEQTCLEKYGEDSVFKSKSIKEKITNTNLEKYGTRTASQSIIIKEKVKHNNLKKYGVDNHMKLQEYQNKQLNTLKEKYGENYQNIFREKQKQTCLKKYGKESATGTNEQTKKRVETCLKKYGKEHWSGTELVKEKKKETIKKNIETKFKNFGFISTDLDTITLQCLDCHTIYTEPLNFIQQRRVQKITLCTKCKPYGNIVVSSGHREIIEYIKTIYLGEVLINNRRVISPDEIDIYIPELKLGIEYNGLYFHSDLFKNPLYHINKTLKAKEKGIKLIQIFEDEWIYKQEIIKSKLNYLLKKNIDKIYARKCIIREVNSKESNIFLEKNHLQGGIYGEINYGLFYNNQLVSLMCFGKNRRALGNNNKEGEYELLRFCNECNTTVIGGANKLFQHFTKTYNPIKITSYADIRWSDGKLYEMLEMKYESKTSPNYWYILRDLREHRYKYRKSELIKQGFDSSKTEKEIMFERGINRIYDCGNYKYVYNN